MPLYKTITVHPGTQVLIWSITEDFKTLSDGIPMRAESEQRVAGMKSEIHRRGFMSVRQLLKEAGYTDHDLWYDQNGKPHLIDNKYVTITHSFEFSALAISDAPIGIDIEKQRPKILKIAHKFTPIAEYRTLANDEAIMRKLTLVWCAKESLYKLYATPGLSFLQHIEVCDFTLESDHSTADIFYQGQSSQYKVHFLEFEGFTCAFAYPKGDD
ncbi:MAG: 4'-phosphopantetheinyl transferase superfamily protein [Gilvibacter sp.]